VLRDFPSPEQTPWMRFDNPREKKLGFFYESSAISDRIRRFLDAMNGFEMLLFLEALTGIDGLIPDPYFGELWHAELSFCGRASRSSTRRADGRGRSRCGIEAATTTSRDI